MYVLCYVRRCCFICYAHTSWSNCSHRTAYTRCVMSAETMIALMLVAFATLGHVVVAFWLRGHVYTAALTVIVYLVTYLGVVIYALA